MKAVFLRAGAILLAASLAGCATTESGPGGARLGETEVTRFHLGVPVAHGQIAIEAADPRASGTPEFRTYADIVGRELLPAQLPVGVVTGVVGAPYLLWLLARANRVGRGG